MIRLDDVYLAPGGADVLVGADWHIRAKDRIGLVGRNGSGKTTLLRALIGDLPPEHGVVHKRGGLNLGYLPQQAVSGSTETVWDEARSRMSRLNGLEGDLRRAEAAVRGDEAGSHVALERASEAFRMGGGYQIEETIGEVLHGLGFGPDAWRRSCSTFSGGWQMRIALARMLLSEPDVLLLDEPTNHLDLHTRAWLARYLARSGMTVVVVTHDRYLLDRVCTRICEVRNKGLHHYKGNFSQYLAERELREAQAQTAFVSQKGEIAKLERFVERFGAKATKAAQARSRQNRLDRIVRLDAPVRERLPRFSLCPAPPGDAQVLLLRDATLGWTADEPVLTNVNLLLERGMRVAVLGPNGCGKSTLLQTLAGRLRPLKGRRRMGQRIRLGVFDQDLAASLPADSSALDHVMGRAPRAGETRVRGVLGALGLSGGHALRPIAQLSGGEKARVALATLGAAPHNALLLDEPTNHLDAVTVEVLVRALAEFDGALLLVSHDRYLVEKIATHVLIVGDGGVELREGVRPEDLESRGATRTGDSGQVASSSGAKSHEDRKRAARERTRAQRRITRIEALLEGLDDQLSDSEQAMFASATDYKRARELSDAHRLLQEQQEALYAEWEELDRLVSES